MSLHRARIKTREEFKKIVCCDKVYDNAIEFFGTTELIVDMSKKQTNKHNLPCPSCGAIDKDKSRHIYVIHFKSISPLLIDIDEHPLSQDEVNALLHNGVSQ